MNRIIRDMRVRLRIAWVTSWFVAAIGTFSLPAYGQPASPAGGTPNASESVLVRDTIVPLTVVNRFFPEVIQEASKGQNPTAVGRTTATRSVIYTNSDGSKKVTISVDQYASLNDASLAYQEAVQKSKTVPGFKPVSAPGLGDNAFIGTVTQGKETHIGLGALRGTLIVGATLAGYDPTDGNIARLLSLTREEEAAARAALDRTAHH
jgi:hypothetical protein